VSVPLVPSTRPLAAQQGLLPLLGQNDRSVRVPVHNHCQKDVEGLTLRLAYLDASGRTLKEARHHVAAYDEHADRLQTLVAGYESGFVTLPDAEIPEKTERITAALTAVEFADGTTWSP
jgi:hypothetical protein